MGCWESLWAETVDRRTVASPLRSPVIGLASLKTMILRDGTRFHEQHSLLMTEPSHHAGQMSVHSDTTSVLGAELYAS